MFGKLFRRVEFIKMIKRLLCSVFCLFAGLIISVMILAKVLPPQHPIVLKIEKTKQITLDSLLLQAPRTGSLFIVKSLVNMGANVKKIHLDNNTPLYMAAWFGDPEIVKYLLSKGADINVDYYSSVYNSILSYDKGYDPSYGYPNSQLSLFAAIRNEHLEATKLLLDTNIILNSMHYQTALSVASRNPNNKIYPLVLNYYWKILKNYKHNSINDHYQSKKTFEVVIVRYNEDLSWIAKEFDSSTKITIYNKGDNDLGYLLANYNIINIHNVGYLGGTYLLHIVNNYYNLADRTLFLQGWPYDSQSIFLPLIKYRDTLGSTCFNVIGKCTKTSISAQEEFFNRQNWRQKGKYLNFIQGKSNIRDFFDTFIHKKYSAETGLTVTYGAQFAVDKEKILNNNMNYYQKMLPTFNYQYPMEDHYLERLWDILFQK